jgi:hypothetical protein
LDKESQTVYLATSETPENDLRISFAARPMSLETSLVIADKKALNKAYKAAKAQSETFYNLLTDLGTEWQIRLQQMEYDEASESSTHYKDLHKDGVDKLEATSETDEDGEGDSSFEDLINKAAYLNGEDNWVVPMTISRLTSSEKIAVMGTAVTEMAVEYVTSLMPIVRFLTGKVRKKKKKTKDTAKEAAKPEISVEETTIRQPSDAADLQKFSYVSELKPLHIRRGFINLTPNHWPFFALNARTETREVTIQYEDKKDKKSAVWRLVPNDQARIVLSPTAQEWLEENFDAGDRIQVEAIKSEDDEIQINLLSI